MAVEVVIVYNYNHNNNIYWPVGNCTELMAPTNIVGEG